MGSGHRLPDLVDADLHQYHLPRRRHKRGRQWQRIRGAVAVNRAVEAGAGQTHLATPPLKNQIANKPFALLDIPCAIIRAWIATARFVPTQSIVDKLNTIISSRTVPSESGAPGFTSIDVAHLQSINDAYSTVVNLDYFPVTITQLPVVNGQTWTPAQFLNYIRTNINTFVNGNAVFSPYNAYGINDGPTWNSTAPVGAAVGINLFGPDDGSVITTYSAPDRWTFTTIHEPMYGDHPVSGNRNFGYTTNADGSYTFYTRGVDRLTSWDGALFQDRTGIPFNKNDELWTSLQIGISSFVNNHSGSSFVNTVTTERPLWAIVKDVIDGRKPLSTLSTDCPD